VVLGIDITREGFEWALRHAALSSYEPQFHASHEDWKRGLEAKPVRIQWDPERDWRLQPVANMRSLQLGLSGEAVERYVSEWSVRIEDVTSIARTGRRRGRKRHAAGTVAQRVGATLSAG